MLKVPTFIVMRKKGKLSQDYDLFTICLISHSGTVEKLIYHDFLLMMQLALGCEKLLHLIWEHTKASWHKPLII